MLRTLFGMLLLLLLGMLSGCVGTNEIVTTRVVVVRVTGTPGPGIAPASTPLPTRTPAPTPTPTPTAPPAVVLGNPLAGLSLAPAPVGGAPCGLADWLDFPLSPPDAEGARGGGDFGTFRSRYDKYHAGEDWGMISRSSLGAPVSSAGHGQVTYAAPLGWGLDQGVVIVRHVFQDGRSLLSFYGHLDPDSVTLRPGACVARGDRVGAIGDPRGRPHLHFEIRTHMPDLPGPGYWPSDPVRAGWLPPSATIWESRLRVQESVSWVRNVGRESEPLGYLDGWGFLMWAGGRLAGIQMETGAVAWERVLEEEDRPVDAVALSPDESAIYLADQAGQIRALALREAAGLQPDLTPLWEVDVDLVGRPTLLPLTGGGLVAAAGERLVGLSADGAVRWSRMEGGRIEDWAWVGGRLLLSIRGEAGGIWEIGPLGPARRIHELNGALTTAGEQVYVYSAEALTQLDLEAGTARQALVLPPAFPSLGDALGLPDGGLLLAHSDRSDRRLIAVDPSGRLRWERSLEGAVGGQPALALVDGIIYLTAMDPDGRLNLFEVDVQTGALRWLMAGGTRTPQPANTALYAAGAGRLVLQIGGGSLVGLEGVR